MEQLPLNSFRNPITHRDDPETSKEAAERIQNSGARQTHAGIGLATGRDLQRLTAPEIAERCGLGEYQVRRRLTDLRSARKVSMASARICAVKGTRLATWVLVTR